MDIRQAWHIAWRNLSARKARSLLTLLGMIVGVAAVVIILSVQQGMVNQVNASYQEYSPSLMFMVTYRPVDSSQNFTAEDMERVAAEHPEYITAVSPAVYLPESNIRYGGQSAGFEDFGVMGVNEQYMAISPLLQLTEGRFLQPMDMAREQKVCVVNQLVADAMGGDPLGQTLRIRGENFQVVGVLAEVEDDQEQFNGIIYIPYTVAKRMEPDGVATLVDGSEYYMAQYYVNANGMDNIPNARISVSDALQAVYGENIMHYSASFRYMRNAELTPIYATVKKLLAAAGLVLLVGGVGIMNVMLAVVGERTKEIGVRKAFGARQRDIRWQFVLESVSISLVGGLIGLVLGAVGSCVACQVLALPLRWLNGSALIVPALAAAAAAMLVGVLFGLYPANKAAKMEIVDCIRE